MFCRCIWNFVTFLGEGGHSLCMKYCGFCTMCYDQLTLDSTSVHSFTLLSGDPSLLRLLTLDKDTSLLTLVLDTPIWPPLGLPREAMRVDRRVLSLVDGVLGRECLSTSTSVNWTEVPPPLVRWISPCRGEWQYNEQRIILANQQGTCNSCQ